jgi:hypothetical protein
MAFSPDGSLLAAAHKDGVSVWEVPDGNLVARLLVLRDGWVAFTPDGRYKLGGDVAGDFWHQIGDCRFEPGELDPFLPSPLRVPEGEPLFVLPNPATAPS